MTKARLMSILKDVPDNANILIWNEKECDYMPVTDVDVREEKAHGSDIQVVLKAMW